MRILFAGTPEIGVPALALLSARHHVVAVLTAPDSSSGRGRRLESPAVKLEAEERGIPVIQPERLGGAARKMVLPYRPDLLVCIAYGRIFGPRFLELFPRGGINVHPSLLPRHRGPSPIAAAILSGDNVTGVTVQTLALDTDAGDVYAQREFRLAGTETTADLMKQAGAVGAEMLVEVVDSIENGTAKSIAQDHTKATYSRIIQKEDGRIDWMQPAEVIDRAVRAYTPWPLAYTSFDGLRLNILQARPHSFPDRQSDGPKVGGSGAPEGERQADTAAIPGTVLGVDKSEGFLIQTGNGVLSVQRLQLQNKRPLDWKSFLNGARHFPGTTLGG